MKVGIVGHGEEKFSAFGKSSAIALIDTLLKTGDILVSGHSPMGGIDIWAEESAARKGLETDIKTPRQQTWDAEYGYRQRNLDIAKDSKVVHVIVVDEYPDNYTGMRFDRCYHCSSTDHIKSGGCWTGHRAQGLGKTAIWHIIKN